MERVEVQQQEGRRVDGCRRGDAEPDEAAGDLPPGARRSGGAFRRRDLVLRQQDTCGEEERQRHQGRPRVPPDPRQSLAGLDTAGGTGGSPRLPFPTERLNARLAAGEVVVIDGATGTELEARGVPMDDAAWCGVANLDYQDVVRDVHADYIRAGAAVVIANTFSTDRLRLGDAGVADRVEEANRNAVAAALEARALVRRPDVVVAASVSRAAAFGIDGITRRVDRATLLHVYTQQASILAQAGADLIALEMISAPDHGEVALEAARSVGLPVWLGLSAERTADGRIAAWQAPERPFDELVQALAAPDLAAILVMHTDVADVDGALESVFAHWAGPVGVYPHVGSFAPPSWQFDPSFTPADLVAHARRWVERGARLVGGACGLGPAFIEAPSAEFA